MVLLVVLAVVVLSRRANTAAVPAVAAGATAVAVAVAVVVVVAAATAVAGVGSTEGAALWLLVVL
jgi:hypothetical protein